MRAAWISCATLLLGACESSGEQEMTACHSQAERAVASAPSAQSGSRDEYLKACMAAAGYKFDAVSYNCGRGDVYEDAACYVR